MSKERQYILNILQREVNLHQNRLDSIRSVGHDIERKGIQTKASCYICEQEIKQENEIINDLQKSIEWVKLR